jgi:hypothetical protein
MHTHIIHMDMIHKQKYNDKQSQGHSNSVTILHRYIDEWIQEFKTHKHTYTLMHTNTHEKIDTHRHMNTHGQHGHVKTHKHMNRFTDTDTNRHTWNHKHA